MPKKPRKVHFVVSTHWDREWYQSFQGFRHRLVSMFDELLDTMDRDPRFHSFQTDGQSILLEDYLEIRPEREAGIKRLAREGRLEIGPWYVLPDEFLVSGESLIRNIKEGIRVSAKFGNPSQAGFVADIFGHNSQIPQIMRGFGIDNFFMWRGTNEKERKANFRWCSPDGSEVLAYRFGPRWGYCDYTYRVRRSQKIDAKINLEEMVKSLVETVKIQARRTKTETLLVFDGGDHIEIEPRTPDIISLANKRLAKEGFQITMSTLSGYMEDIRKESARITDSVMGELREPSDGDDEQWLIPGVLSSRIHLKQANRRCEDLLCYWAEPFAAMARRHGLSGTESYLHTAWRHLLQNHPHDSICGCSIDQVHKDMIYRFDQCEEIAGIVTRDALHHLVQSVPGEVTAKRFPVLVANPLTFNRSEPTDITLELPADGPFYQEFFGFEHKPGFRIFDAEGNEVPYQLNHLHLDRVRSLYKRGKFPHALRRHLVSVTLPLDLPPLGTRTLWVETVQGPTRHPGKGFVTGHNEMANEFLSVEISENGTITLQDQQSGAFYPGLLTLEDTADIGDGWYHGVAVNDQTFNSRASHAAVSMVHNGPAKTTFKIEVAFEVPTRFDFAKMVRPPERGILRVTHWVTLRRGVRRLEVVTEVDNTIRDHRLRVLFPTFLATETYWADSPFDAVERPIALRPDNYRYKELEVECKPQYTWTAVAGRPLFPECGHDHGEHTEECEHSQVRGLAVISKGLPESAVLDNDDREIALTLLRSFQKAAFTDGNDGGQIQGKHRFEYSLVPFDGEPDPVYLGREGQQLAAGIRSIQAHPLEDKVDSPTPHPDGFSLLEVEGDVLVTSVRGAEKGGLLVRLYNPSIEPSEVHMGMAGGIGRASLASMADQPIDKIPIRRGRIQVEVGSKKILTILLSPGRQAM